MSKTLSRRDFLKLAGVSTGAVVLAACTSPATQAPTSAPSTQGTPTLGNVKLNFAYYSTEGFEDKTYGDLKKLQTNLKAKYPTLDFEPTHVDYQKQAMAMAAGNAADVAVINVPAAWPLIYRHQLINLTDAMASDAEWKEYMTHFVKSTVDVYTYKNALWGIPFSVETSGTIYNEDLLTKAGVKLPHEYSETDWNWDSFVQTAAKATAGADGPDKVWGANMSPEWQSGLGDLVISNGADLLAADGLSSRVTEDAFVEAAQRCVNMVLTDKISPSAQALSNNQLNNYSAFINQKVAFMISGDWAFGWVLNNQLPDKKFKLNWMTSPVSPKTKTVEGVGHSTAFYAWSGSSHIPEALAFVKFLASKEGQNPITENWTKSPIVSPRLDCQDAFWSLNLVPNAAAMKRAYEVAAPYPHTPLISAGAAIGYVNTGLTAVMDGSDTRPMKDVLADIDKQIVTDLAKGAQG